MHERHDAAHRTGSLDAVFFPQSQQLDVGELFFESESAKDAFVDDGGFGGAKRAQKHASEDGGLEVDGVGLDGEVVVDPVGFLFFLQHATPLFRVESQSRAGLVGGLE